MSWTAAQQGRLGMERNILQDKFPGKVTWIDPRSRGKTQVEVAMTTNNDKPYKLRIYIPKDYPNACPDMVVSYPNHLLKRSDGSDLTWKDHAWGTIDGCTKICHYRPNLWTTDNTLYQVFMKGRLWLEVYEIYLNTGKPMGSLLKEMPVSTVALQR